ncbi:MAG: hypothetical protein LKE37_02325 [Atopobiaceae bacterium]|jgi:hypothetical protein|nr:hypothetical protein [Atopobiaceae bacterium]
MSQLSDITIESRQNGVSGIQTGQRLFKEVPGANLEEVVEAFAGAGFPPYETLSGSSEYATLSGSSDHVTSGDRQTILGKMKVVGYPQDEIDDAAARVTCG